VAGRSAASPARPRAAQPVGASKRRRWPIALFFGSLFAIVAIAGCPVRVELDGVAAPMWQPLAVPAGAGQCIVCRQALRLQSDWN